MSDPPKAKDLLAAIDKLRVLLLAAAPEIDAERLTEIEAAVFELLTVTFTLSAGMAVDTIQIAFGRLSTLEGWMAAVDKQMAEVGAHLATEDARLDTLEHDQHPPHAREANT